MDTEWLTVQEVAARLRTTKTSVGKMIRAGTLPAVQVAWRDYRVRAQDVDTLVPPAKKGQAEA